jgi:hypothetical protein
VATDRLFAHKVNRMEQSHTPKTVQAEQLGIPPVGRREARLHPVHAAKLPLIVEKAACHVLAQALHLGRPQEGAEVSACLAEAKD